MKLSDLLNEITLPLTHDDAHARLIGSSGYTHLGGGEYARVSSKDNLPYVVKLFSSRDQATVQYFQLISKYKNVHFPKLYSRLVRVNEQYYAIKVEKLSQANYANWSNFNNDVHKFIHHLNKSNSKTSYDISNPTEAKAVRLIYDNILKKNVEFFLDLGYENVMQRGSTLVLIDPVATDDFQR